MIPPPPGVEPAFTGMPAPTVDVPPRPDEPVAAGSGPQGLPAVDWSFPRALLVGLVTNLLLAQVVVGGIAFIALGITDVEDPKTIYAGLIGDVAWLGFMLIWLVRWHPDWRARIGVFGGRRGLRDVLAGLVGGVLLYPGIVIVGLVLTALFEAVSGRPTTTPDQLPQHLNTPEAIASVILAVFVAPVAEELFFRGILFRSIRDAGGFWLGALVSGLIFGLAPLRGRRLAGHRPAAVDHGLHRRGARLHLRTPGQPPREHHGAHGVQRGRRVPDPVRPLSSTFRILRATVRRDAVPVFASQAWFEAFEAQINASSEYRECRQRLGGRHRVPDPCGAGPRGAGGSWGYLDRGTARAAAAGRSRRPSAEAAAYTLTAPYSRWKDVVEGELDPIKGVMQGKCACTATCRRSSATCRRPTKLVRLTGRIDTQFPDEA